MQQTAVFWFSAFLPIPDHVLLTECYKEKKEKLVRLVNKREKKKSVVRGMATLVPLPQFVVFAELVGWYSTGTRLSCCCVCMRSVERVQSRKM